MKRFILMLIYLLIMPLCRAAVPDESWHQAVQEIPNLQNQRFLKLNDKNITAIPDNLNFPNLRLLWLNKNLITTIENLNLPVLERLHLNNNLITAIDNLNLPPQLKELNLQGNQITTIENLNLPQLVELDLRSNHIEYIDPQILQGLPRLARLDLSKNPLTQNNIDELKKIAAQTHPRILIIADDIGAQHSCAGSIKPAKR